MSKYDLPRIPTAYSFAVCDCGKPYCGIHLVALDESDRPIVQMILPSEIVPEVIANLQAILYVKAVESDDDETQH